MLIMTRVSDVNSFCTTLNLVVAKIPPPSSDLERAFHRERKHVPMDSLY